MVVGIRIYMISFKVGGKFEFIAKEKVSLTSDCDGVFEFFFLV